MFFFCKFLGFSEKLVRFVEVPGIEGVAGGSSLRPAREARGARFGMALS